MLISAGLLVHVWPIDYPASEDSMCYSNQLNVIGCLKTAVNVKGDSLTDASTLQISINTNKTYVGFN
jgi:hypothetical protein